MYVLSCAIERSSAPPSTLASRESVIVGPATVRRLLRTPQVHRFITLQGVPNVAPWLVGPQPCSRSQSLISEHSRVGRVGCNTVVSQQSRKKQLVEGLVSSSAFRLRARLCFPRAGYDLGAPGNRLEYPKPCGRLTAFHTAPDPGQGGTSFSSCIERS